MRSTSTRRPRSQWIGRRMTQGMMRRMAITPMTLCHRHPKPGSHEVRVRLAKQPRAAAAAAKPSRPKRAAAAAAKPKRPKRRRRHPARRIRKLQLRRPPLTLTLWRKKQGYLGSRVHPRKPVEKPWNAGKTPEEAKAAGSKGNLVTSSLRLNACAHCVPHCVFLNLFIYGCVWIVHCVRVYLPSKPRSDSNYLRHMPNVTENKFSDLIRFGSFGVAVGIPQIPILHKDLSVL